MKPEMRMTAAHTKRLEELSKYLSKNSHFGFAKKIYEAHETAEVYLVGGAVRDCLLNRPTKDYDFLVRNVSVSALKKILKPLGSVNLVGRKFGVLKFVPHDAKDAGLEAIDIALPREEYSNEFSGHYRDFTIKSDPHLGIDVDLARRDFTINALAWEIKTKTLHDPYNGYQDLRDAMIRAVGTPDRRFSEDYSRMLRAIRFACTLDFDIEPRTAKALKKNLVHLNDIVTATKDMSSEHEQEEIRAVPYETIAKEFLGAFAGNTFRAFDLYDNLGIFALLAPEMLAMKRCPQPKQWHAEGDVWKHTRLSLEALMSRQFKKEFGQEPDIEMIIAVLLHDIGKPYTLKTPKKDKVDRIRFDGHDRVGAQMAQTICERLRLSSASKYPVDTQHVWWLINYHLMPLNSIISQMTSTTVEKYFFKDVELGTKLMMMLYADAQGCRRLDNGSTLGTYTAMKKRIAVFKQTANVSQKLPAPILDGTEIMKLLGITAGPRVGELLIILREEQLSGRVRTKAHAKTFIKNHTKS